MLSRRAPLFSVSLALALGCLVGLDGWISLKVALAAFVLAGIFWASLARFERASLAAFYLLAACAGLTHTLLLAASVSPDDLRRLPDDKTFSTTQWRGLVIEEPVAQLSPHTAHHALDRTSFVLGVEAWRPTGGRLFAAPIEAPWLPARGRIRCTLIGPAQNLQCGDRLEFAAALDPVRPPLSPGQIDDRFFEAEQSVYYHASLAPPNWRRTRRGAGNFIQALSFRARDWAYARLQIGLEDDPRVADFLAGMLIGYRQEIPADIEQDFRRTGTLHVFAVSGQNIAEMMAVAIVLLQLFGFVRWRWAWILTPVLLVYCLLTGSPASAVRATVMVFAILAAWKMGRPLHALGCWSIAFIVMLLWNPAVLLDPGAQLSFGVVLGLILLSRPIQRLLVRPVSPDPFLPAKLLTRGQRREEVFWIWATSLLSATIAATLVSEPITAVDFHQVTPVSVFANMVVVPAAGLITVVGTLAVAFSPIFPLWTALLNNANWLFARALIAFVGFLAHEPGASLNVADLRALATPPPSLLVFPAQDSACLLVRTGRETWLFNTGREGPARSATCRVLQFYGINRLDGLVLAQLSAADNAGADVLIRDYHPRRVVIPVLRTRSPLEKAMPAALALADHPAEAWQRGQCLALSGGLTVEVLEPSGDSRTSHAEDRALILLFRASDQTLLWAGKIGPELQWQLVADYPGLRADLLVLSPDSAPSPEWLRALQIRDWLQIPPRDKRVNITTRALEPIPTWIAWPLDETGAVSVQFRPAERKIVFRPWVALPGGT